MSESRIPRQVGMALQEAREALSSFLESLNLEKISKHNRGYLAYAKDPLASFIDVEAHSHTRIVHYLFETLPAKSRIIDIGFFIPVVPIALARLGFQVSSIEKLAFYDNALDEIIALASGSYGIEVHNLDILHDDIGSLEKFDGVILSAILEHLNGSPKTLLHRAKQLGTSNANYVVTVPNVASIRKRISFLLKGYPPFPPISTYYHSSYPFTGHNREYSISDLRYVLSESGFGDITLETYNRPVLTTDSLKNSLMNIMARFGPESFREAIIAVARKTPCS